MKKKFNPCGLLFGEETVVSLFLWLVIFVLQNGNPLLQTKSMRIHVGVQYVEEISSPSFPTFLSLSQAV